MSAVSSVVQSSARFRAERLATHPMLYEFTFEVRKRAARAGRNPATGAELKIKASKAPAFKAGATLKATVNGIKK